MFCENSHAKSESLAQIRTIMAELQYVFEGIVFYWRIMYIWNKFGGVPSSNLGVYDA